jgi:GNAT superfamily N-acetyltransferase
MEGEEPVLQTRPSYAEIASVQGMSPNAMRKAPSIGDFSDEKLMEMMKSPLTGEEVAAKIADLNANGVDIDATTISKEEFIAYDDWRKKQHFNFWGAVGDGAVQATKELAGGVVSAATDWKKLGLAAAVGVIGTPVAGLAVAFGASAIEGFARGTRDLGGLAVMAANHPDSPLYRMFVNPTDDKDVAYEDFLDLSRWNAQSEKILTGKTNAFMPDRQTYEKLFGKQFGDTIDDFVGVNKELATAASYVLDPTTFMTFGGGAAAKTVAAKAGAAALKSGQAGNAVGHVVAATASRNAAKATFLNSFGETMIKTSNTLTKPIDAMFDAITGGMERLTGVRHNVSPVTGDVKAQRVHAGHGGEKGPRSLTHALMGVGGVYSAFSIPYALPITSVYAGLKGLKYLGEGISDLATKGAKNADSVVGNAIRASSPVGIYMTDLAKTTIHGGIYGGAIGYATAGEEGAAGGIGTGVAIGAIGHNVGYAYGTISGKFAKDALYKEFDEHMVNLKDKGDLLKQERVMKFINDIKDQHGQDEALRAISHVMGLEKSKNVTVSYMNYDDMVKALQNDPNMTYWEDVDVDVPKIQIKPDTLKPLAPTDPTAPKQPSAANPPTKKRVQKLTPMGETLFQAVQAKANGGQGWNGMFTNMNPITGKIETRPYALWKNGETGMYHVIINIDNVQSVRDAAGNVVKRYGPEGERPEFTVPEGDEVVTQEQTSVVPEFETKWETQADKDGVQFARDEDGKVEATIKKTKVGFEVAKDSGMTVLKVFKTEAEAKEYWKENRETILNKPKKPTGEFKPAGKLDTTAPRERARRADAAVRRLLKYGSTDGISFKRNADGSQNVLVEKLRNEGFTDEEIHSAVVRHKNWHDKNIKPLYSNDVRAKRKAIEDKAKEEIAKLNEEFKKNPSMGRAEVDKKISEIQDRKLAELEPYEIRAADDAKRAIEEGDDLAAFIEMRDPEERKQQYEEALQQLNENVSAYDDNLKKATDPDEIRSLKRERDRAVKKRTAIVEQLHKRLKENNVMSQNGEFKAGDARKAALEQQTQAVKDFESAQQILFEDFIKKQKEAEVRKQKDANAEAADKNKSADQQRRDLPPSEVETAHKVVSYRWGSNSSTPTTPEGFRNMYEEWVKYGRVDGSRNKPLLGILKMYDSLSSKGKRYVDKLIAESINPETGKYKDEVTEIVTGTFTTLHNSIQGGIGRVNDFLRGNYFQPYKETGKSSVSYEHIGKNTDPKKVKQRREILHKVMQEIKDRGLYDSVKEEFRKEYEQIVKDEGFKDADSSQATAGTEVKPITEPEIDMEQARKDFEQTDEYKRNKKNLDTAKEALAKAEKKFDEKNAPPTTQVRSTRLKQDAGLGWSRPAKKQMQGPLLPTSETTMVQIAKTAPLGELWHVMNQVYREVNHQQTITNEVRNWLLNRAFTNRADTVKFMLETYGRIGGRARDMSAEGGRWIKAINEFEQTGKIENPDVADSFNRFCEELGEAIFLGWEDGQPFDYIFRGGDLGFARGLLNDIADSFYNRALRDATNLGADIRTKDAFVDWFKKSKNSGVRIDPILADTFKDLVRFYNDKNMKNAGLNRTDLVRFSPAQIKDHARIYGYENRLQYGPNGEVTGLKPMLQYNQETHMAGKAMIEELAELATVDEAALNGLDFYVYNDKDDVDLAMDGTDGTLDTVGKSGQGFLFQSPDYKGMGVGLDDIVNAQIAKAKRDGIYAARDATSFGKRGRARTTPTGKMGEMMKEALAKGQHVVFRGIPTEKAFKIIEKYVPKAVADNVRLLAPIIADGGFSRPNVINGKYLGFTQAQRDGTILSREWGDEFSPRDVTFVPYDMQFKITLKDLKNPNQDYKRPHFRFNVRSVDIDALNRRGTILWNQSPELQKLYNGLHEFKADIFKTMDEYSGSGMIPATDFFGADDNARLKRKHVVAAIGASPNTKAQLLFSAAETEWHPYQKRDRGAEQNNPWFWMHMDGLHGLHTVDGEVMRMRMNEKGYYRAMIPTPTSEGAVGPNGVMMNQMYQNPDELGGVDREKQITDLRAKLLKINEVMAGVRGMQRYSPEATRMLQLKREFQAKLDFLEGKEGVVDSTGSRQMFQSPDKLADLNYDAMYGKGMGPLGKRDVLSTKKNLTPVLAGTRYDMLSEAWVAGFVGKIATQNNGGWRYVGKNGDIKEGNVRGHTTEFKIRKLSEGKGKYRLDVGVDFYDSKGHFWGSIGGELSEDKKTIKNVSVSALADWQGKGYGNMMYSELLERMRALGVENFDGEIINKMGAPVGVRDNMFGAGNSYIMGKDWDTEIKVATDKEIVRRLQGNIDLGDYNGVRVRSKINKSAFYQSPDAPIKLDIESMRRFNDETSDKPYDVNRVADGLDDPIALLKKLNKLDIFKKSKLREDYSYAETYGAKNDQDASFLASNFKYAAEKGDVFQSEALKRFVQQTTGSKDIPAIRHTLEEFVSSTNAGPDAYNQSFKTGVPVAFVATQGTVSPKLGGGDFRRDIKALKAHNHFNGQQATSYAYSYGGPQFANDANAFPEGNQIRAAVGMKNPLVYDFKGEYMRDDIVSTLVDKSKREKRDGIVMLNAIDPRVSSNVKDNHYIIPKGNEAQIAVLDNSFGKRPVARGLGGAEGAKMFQNPDDGVTLPKGIFGPNNPETVKIARTIMMKKGVPHSGGQFIVRLNPEKSFKVGMEYDRMKHDPFNPQVRQAYEAMARETLEQYQAIVDAGYTAEMHYEQSEPYANSREVIMDIRDNKRLRVLATDLNFGTGTVSASDIKENPLLAMSQYKDANGRQMRINDVFRFVHDFFGHSERGNGFGPIGEENAWDVHSRMYSPLARRAMTTETRGQNSWVNFVNEANIEINRKRDLVRKLESEGKIVEAAEIRRSIGQIRFADNKLGLMPDWTSKIDAELTPIETELYGVHQTVSGGFGLYQQPDGYDVNIHSPSVEQFSAIGNAAKANAKFGTSVDIKAPHDYEGYELLMAGDGLAQVSISPDGELGSLVRGPNGKASDVDAVLRAALATGKVKWLNGFDTILPSLYSEYGFEAVARLAFVDEYRPDGWDYNLYGKYNNGRPDVVFMALVGNNAVPYEKNGKHIPMVSSYDDAVRVTKERNRQAQNGGQMFQNADISILSADEKPLYELNELRLKYAEYIRFVDGQIHSGIEGFNKANRILKLREWLAKNGPKNEKNQPMYNPLSIGERVRVGNTMVDIKDFDKTHRDVVLEGLLDKARERAERSAGVQKGTPLTPEQIATSKRLARRKVLLEGMAETARERFQSMSEEKKEEYLELVKKAKRRNSRKKKETTTGDIAEDIANANEDESAAESVEANIEKETEELIESGVDPAEAKRIAIENAQKNAQKIEYGHDPVIEGEDPVDTIRYYATVATREEVAKMLKDKDTDKDMFTDEDYLDLADTYILQQQSLLKDIETGQKRPMPKDTTKFGGEGPEIDTRPPTIKLVDLYKKYKGSEWFSEDGKPLQWRKKDGTIVKSDTKPSGAEAVEPPEIMEMKAQIEKSIKEIKAIDYNTRGISALVGLMYLWGYRLNPNLLDKGFDPAFVDMEKMVTLFQTMTPEHALRAELATSGSLVHMFEEGAAYKTIVASIPDLVDTTSDVLSLIMRTTEFSAGTFGSEKNVAGAPIEAKELMEAKFVEKYYIMLKNNKGNTYGATFGDIFYRDAQDYAEDKIRDKKKNFEKTHNRPPSVFEVKKMTEELEDYYNQMKGRILINQFFAPEGPIDPKTGKVKSGWKDKTTSIEKNIKNRLRETSNAAKKAQNWANVLTEEQIRNEAKSMTFNLQREFIEFMFEEANAVYEEQIARQEEASKRKQMTAIQRQEARRKANTSNAVYPQTGAMGWDAKLEQNRERIKKLEDANTPKEERDAIIAEMNIQPTDTKRSDADVASETASLSDMQAEVKKVEEAHRKAQAEAREKQGLPPVQALEVKPPEPVTPQISQAVPPAPETSNLTAKPTSRAEHEQREKMRKVMAEMTGEPFEPIPYIQPAEPVGTVLSGTLPAKPVPVVEAKDTPNVDAYDDVDITEPASEDAPPPPKKKKVTVETQAVVDTARNDQADANVVKPPEQVAVSVATVEQVGPIGARSAQHQQAVKDVLAIQDNLTLEMAGDGNRKSVATKDKRYVVWKGVGNNNKGLYVWMAAHEDIYRGTPLEKRRIAVVSSYEEAQLAIREFDNLMRVLAEREGLNTSQIVQASAPVMTPVQAKQTATQVAQQVKQNPTPPPATPTRKAHQHPEFSNAIIGLKMVIRMSNADAKKMVETAIDKLGEKATLTDIINQVLLDRQALAATVARANEQFAASVNAGAAANPDAVANVTITPSQIGLRNSTGAPRLPAGPLSNPNAEIVQPFNFNPSQGEIAAYKMLTTFRTHIVKYPVGNGGQADGVMYVNPANYSIVQSGPSKWRLFNPAKALMSVWDNEQEACDAIFKHYFKR